MNLHLPSELQRIAPFIAVAILAVAGLLLITRGMGGSGGGGTDAPQAVERAFTTDPNSGVLDLRLNSALEVRGRAPDTTTYSFTGPYTKGKAAGDKLATEGDFRVTETGGANAVSLRLILSDGRGYLGYRGRFYELTAKQARNVFGAGAQQPLLESLGFNVKNWIVDPKVVGTARVDGIHVDHVAGKLNADAMLNDIGKLGTADERNSAGTAILRNATKDGEVDVFVGSSDGIVRKVNVTSRFATEARQTPVQATLRFDVGVRDVNEPQDVNPPANPLPARRMNAIPASQLGSLAAQLRGAAPSPGNGGRAGAKPREPTKTKSRTPTSPRTTQVYISCVEQARDAGALEKCQASMPKR